MMWPAVWSLLLDPSGTDDVILRLPGRSSARAWLTDGAAPWGIPLPPGLQTPTRIVLGARPAAEDLWTVYMWAHEPADARRRAAWAVVVADLGRADGALNEACGRLPGDVIRQPAAFLHAAWQLLRAAEDVVLAGIPLTAAALLGRTLEALPAAPSPPAQPVTRAFLGRGGMAEVWKVLGADGWVAHKIPLPHITTDPGLRERFRREAELLQRVRHPHVLGQVSLHEAPDGTPYMRMELVEGGSLQEVVRTGPQPTQRVATWAAQVLAGLEALHKEGIWHRDIKPSNLLLRQDQSVVIADFGIAFSEDDVRLTRRDEALGSLAYMAREHQRGNAVAASDLYSLAVTLHEILTGGLPQVRPGQDVPGAFGDLLRRMGAEDAGLRPTASAAKAIVEAMLRPPPASPQAPGLPFSRAWYAERRRLEAECAAYLQDPGSPLVLVGAQCTGKAWLLARVVQDAADRFATVTLDLRTLSKAQAADHDAVLGWIVDGVSEALDLDDGPSGANVARNFRRWLKNTVLPRRGLLLALRNVDHGAREGDVSALFGTLRALVSDSDPAWDRLRLAMTVSTDPALLVRNPNLSPFNLAPPVRVGVLDRAQVAWLVERHGVGPDCVELLLAEAGGQPMLTRIVLYETVMSERSVQVVLDGALEQDGRVVGYLKPILESLRLLPEDKATLRQLLDNPDVRLDILIADRLVGAGLLVRHGQSWRIANRLTERFLRMWL